MTLWPFRITFLPGRQRATPDQLCILALGAAALAVPFFLRPAGALLGTHIQLFLPPCFFYRVTTIPCPTCGITTSFSLLTHGQLARAFLAHPLGPLVFLDLAVSTLLMAGATLARRAVHVAMRASLLQIALALGASWALKLAVWYLR